MIAELAKTNGSEVLSAYYAFGEYDIVMIIESPSNVAAAGILISAAGGGAVSNIRTTVLLTNDEGLEAIGAAGDIGYTPPT